ncbi:alpha/beta hydrolase [Nocardioides KLBMP 9356]|uniref:Alpha/beta hydrolase n=1 Tax=Nocardioides potassii TaxID=2911371 RepID=A0ABS9H922_9ACTN|nr:alpha/beta hydrolase [Nocardioides potassii]MCF6376767.1 alpha/beta hydrolase [Nocardioides potassii]
MADYLTLHDGRTVEHLEGGDPEGFPLVYHSGTPSGAVEDEQLFAAAGAAGLRLVTYSRPGYGRSTPRGGPDHVVAPVLADAADTEALLDHLDIDEFITLGWSGGGPRALACAAAMPGRCRAASLLAGVAPFDADGLDWLAGMGEENVRDFEAVQAGRETYRPIAVQQADELRSVSGDDIVLALGDLVDEVDAAALTGAFAETVAASFRHAMAQGPVGMIDDNLQIVAPWGFDVRSITVPVAVWQGEHDRMVPYAHGQWLAAAIPGARPHLFADEGHLSLVARIDEILADLRVLAGL